MNATTFKARLKKDFEEPSLRDQVLIDQALAFLDGIAGLERAVKSQGESVKGSKGQPIANPALRELRQQRAALARVLDLLFAENGSFVDHQRSAAKARWARAS